MSDRDYTLEIENFSLEEQSYSISLTRNLDQGDYYQGSIFVGPYNRGEFIDGKGLLILRDNRDNHLKRAYPVSKSDFEILNLVDKKEEFGDLAYERITSIAKKLAKDLGDCKIINNAKRGKKSRLV